MGGGLAAQASRRPGVQHGVLGLSVLAAAEHVIINGDPRDPLTDLVHHAGGVVSEITRTGQGQHVLHDACSLSCGDYGSNRAARTTMKTTGVSRSAYSPWCPTPRQRLGPTRTSWLAPSVSSSRRRPSARYRAEIE